jgi:TonB family protein
MRRLPAADSGLTVPPQATEARRTGSGALGEALRNLQRYVQKESFDNPRGGNTQQFGPFIQFDTKGVEFGPWIRRFVAQVKRNWNIPYAAMMLRGHVVLQFNVHKDGSITDVAIVGPSSVDGFNNAAANAILSSNPTEPLPPEYPADKAFFTVTFYYNEEPSGQ